MVTGPPGDKLVPCGQLAALEYGGSQDGAAQEPSSVRNQEVELRPVPAVVGADG